MTEPVEATKAFWQDLGLPELFDVHVHFLPPDIQRRVWAQFDQAGPRSGREWPIRHRQSVGERVQLLGDLGVRRFPALPYAHRPSVATYLNDWARSFAHEVPESLWSATFVELAVPFLATVTPGGPGRQGAAGQRLPDDPVRLPAPAGVTRAVGSGGTLAACGVLPQRCPSLRNEPTRRRPVDCGRTTQEGLIGFDLGR